MFEHHSNKRTPSTLGVLFDFKTQGISLMGLV